MSSDSSSKIICRKFSVFVMGNYGKCFLNRIFSCRWLSLMDEGRAVRVIYFGFTMAFDTVSHSIFIDKQIKYNLNKWAVRWTENRQKRWSERWLSLVEHPRGWYLNIFMKNLDEWTEFTPSKPADDAELGRVVEYQMMVVLPFRRNSTIWRNGQTGLSGGSRKQKAFTWQGITCAPV